jgi:leader peptidase (prepilin peptidase)/N-methyltransferase
MPAVIIAACAVVGLLVGSFLNVVIALVPRGESVVQPPSHCLSCGTVLIWQDNVPVLSWVVLRGRCRSCSVAISVRYPEVEVGCAALYALMAWRFGAHPDLAAYLVAGAGLFALSVIDLDTKRLPNRVLFPTFVATAALLVLASAVDQRWGDLGRAAVGAGVSFIALFAVHFARPDGLGFGDVKLAGLLGMILGWLGLTEVALGIYGGFVLGAVGGILLIAAKRARFGRAIPFGPFLAAATILTVLAGGPLADRIRYFWAG